MAWQTGPADARQDTRVRDEPVGAQGDGGFAIRGRTGVGRLIVGCTSSRDPGGGAPTADRGFVPIAHRVRELPASGRGCTRHAGRAAVSGVDGAASAWSVT